MGRVKHLSTFEYRLKMQEQKRCPMNDFDVVTVHPDTPGRYITRVLLLRGKRRVKTLTGHPTRANPFGDQIEATPFNFDRPDELKRSRSKAPDALFNTYWIRFPYGGQTFDTAVANTRITARCGQSGRRSQVRSHQRDQRDGVVTAAVFPRQGAGRSGDQELGAQLRDHSAGADFRRRRYFAQQHRVAAEAIPVLRDSRDVEITDVQPIFAGDLARLPSQRRLERRSIRHIRRGRVRRSSASTNWCERLRERGAQQNRGSCTVDPRSRSRSASDGRMVRARRYAHAGRSSRPDEQSAGDGFMRQTGRPASANGSRNNADKIGRSNIESELARHFR